MLEGEIVTGCGRTNHIDSEDLALQNAMSFGYGEFVFDDVGNFEATLESANSLLLAPGVGMMQGRMFRLRGAGGTLTLENGTQGQNRNDLVVVRYVKTDEGYEDCFFDVIKGTPTSGTPEDPPFTHSDILHGGAPLNEMLLYRVPFTGIQVGEPERLFEVRSSVQGEIKEVRDSLSQRFLWSSESGFSSGSMEVPGISSYSCLLIRSGNIWALASVTRDKTKVMGGSAFLYNSSSYRTLVMDFALSGDTLTYGRALEQGASAIIQDRIAVNEIVGLF